MSFGVGQFFGGPLRGKQVAFCGTPPPHWRVPQEPPHHAYVVAEQDEYPPLIEPEVVEYRKIATTAEGLAIYDFVEPTEEAEVTFIIRVPKKLSRKQRGRLVARAEDALNAVENVSARLHYTGPLR